MTTDELRHQCDKLVKICEEVLMCGEQSGQDAPFELREASVGPRAWEKGVAGRGAAKDLLKEERT